MSQALSPSPVPTATPSPDREVSEQELIDTAVLASQTATTSPQKAADLNLIGKMGSYIQGGSASAFRGLFEGLGGMTQAGVGLFSKGGAQAITDFVNNAEKNVPVLQHAPKESNVANAILYGLGGIAPWVAASAITGGGADMAALPAALRTTLKAAQYVPAFARDAATGALAGYTTFKHDLSDSGRYVDSLIGAFGGVGAGYLGRALFSFLAKAGNSQALRTVLNTLKASTKYIDTSHEGNTLARAYQKAFQNTLFRKDLLYSIPRDALEGDTVEADPIQKEIAAYGDKFKTSANKGQSQGPGLIGDVLANVKATLRTPFDKRQEQIDALLEKMPELAGSMKLPANLGVLKAAGFDLVNKEAKTITGLDLLQARRVVSLAMQRTKGSDVTRLSQLRGLRDILTKNISDILPEGLSVNRLESSLVKADAYYAKVYRNYENFPGFQPKYPKQIDPASHIPTITGPMTHKEIYDRLTKIFDSNDTGLVKNEVQLLGGVKNKAGALLRSFYIRHALEQGITPGGDIMKDTLDLNKIALYLKSHRNIGNALGNGDGDSLYGLMNLLHGAAHSGRITEKLERYSAPLLTLFGAERVARGEFSSGMQLIASGFIAAHAMNSILDWMSSPVLRRYSLAAAKLPPNSPQLLRLLEKAAPIALRYIGSRTPSFLIPNNERTQNNVQPGSPFGNLIPQVPTQ